jgi:hypothetical protein
MSNDKRKRTLHYKLAKLSDKTETLQRLLENVLVDRDSDYICAKSRQQRLTDDGKAFRFINSHSSHGSDLRLFQLVQFEEGLSQMTIVMDDNAEAYELNPFTPQDIKNISSKGKKKTTEFLDSMLYFGVLGNHVVILGSQSLKSKELENHLNWFLKDHTQQLSTLVYLSDKPTLAAIKQIEKHPAKSVKLGSDLEFEAIAIEPQYEEYEQKINETNRISWSPKSIGAEILSFLKETGRIDQLKFDDSFDYKNLHMTLELTYNRTTSKKGQKALDTIATSLRHFDKDDVKISLKGGGEIKGDELKLSTSISLDFINGKINEASLSDIIVKWLNSKLKANEVTADFSDLTLV